MYDIRPRLTVSTGITAPPEPRASTFFISSPLIGETTTGGLAEDKPLLPEALRCVGLDEGVAGFRFLAWQRKHRLAVGWIGLNAGLGEKFALVAVSGGFAPGL